MRLFADQEPGRVELSDGRRLHVADTNLPDAAAISTLVGKNKVVLEQRFPGLASRYKDTISSKEAIRGVQQSDTIAGLSLFVGPEGEEQLVGRASIMLGRVVCKSFFGRERVIIERGANVAMWLDEPFRNRGLGTAAGKLILAAIPGISGANPNYDVRNLQPFTFIASDNEPSKHMVQKLGFVPVMPREANGRYNFAGGKYDDTLFVLR